MAIREVTFTVTAIGNVTPAAPQCGGVQGEHNVTEVIFKIPNSLDEVGVYRVECRDNTGRGDTSDTILRVTSGSYVLIKCLLPNAWTQYGGKITLHLVRSHGTGEDMSVVYLAEASLFFWSREVNLDGVYTPLTELITQTRAAQAGAILATNAVKAALREAEEAYEDGVFSPNIQIGTVVTGAPGTAAKVTRRGSNKNPIFDFVIPRGERGQVGDGSGAIGVSPLLTVSVFAGAKVTCSLIGGDRTATEISDGTARFYLPLGEWKVTATYSRQTVSTVVNLSSIEQYDIALSFWSETFENNTWDAIADAAELGLAETLWSIGDTKNAVINGSTYALSIVDFGHDDLTAGGKAGITLGIRHLLPSMSMTKAVIEGPRYVDSEMYQWVLNTFIPSLPSELKKFVKTVNKKTRDPFSLESVITPMEAFLFSQVEVFGEGFNRCGDEGTQYSLFATVDERVKCFNNGAGAASPWWLRSSGAIGTADQYSFYSVTATGWPAGAPSTNYMGVCVGICL